MCYHNDKGKRLAAKHGVDANDIQGVNEDGYTTYTEDPASPWGGYLFADIGAEYRPVLTFHPWESREQQADLTWVAEHPFDSTEKVSRPISAWFLQTLALAS